MIAATSPKRRWRRPRSGNVSYDFSAPKGGLLTEETDQEYGGRARKEVEAAPYPDTDAFYDHVHAQQQR